MLNATQVNGLYVDHTSVRVIFPNSKMFLSHLKSINYEQSLTPSEAYGTHSIPLPTGLGQSKATCTLTVVKEAFDNFVKNAGDGYMAVVFDLPVLYVPHGEFQSITDTLQGCRVIGQKLQSSQGQGGLEVELTLYVRNILFNGVSPVPLDVDQIPYKFSNAA